MQIDDELAKHILQSLNVPLLVFDTEGQVLHNSVVLKVLGYAESSNQLRLEDMFSESEVNVLMQIDVIQDFPHLLHLNIRDIHGILHPAEITLNPLMGQANRYVATLSIVEYSPFVEVFIKVAKSLNMGLMICDDVAPDYPILIANDALCSMLGYARDELLNRTFRQFFNEPTQTKISDVFARVTYEGSTEQLVIQSNRRNKKPFEANMFVTSFADSHSNKLLCILHDATSFNILNQMVENSLSVKSKHAMIYAQWSISFGRPVLYISDDIRIYGYEPEDIISGEVNYLRDIIYPDDMDRVHQEFTEAVNYRLPYLVQQYRIVTASDEVRWIEDFTRLVYDDPGANGEGFLFDITEKKQIEETRKQSEDLYRALAKNLPDFSIIVFDRNKRLTIVEGEYFEQFGFKKHEVEGRLVHEVLSAQTVAFLNPLYDAALRGEHAEKQVQFRDHIFKLSAVPVTTDDGQSDFGMILIQDVTKESHARQELLESEERLRLAIDTANMGTWDWDLKTNSVTWNRKHYELFQVPIGTPITFEVFLDRVHPDDRENVKNAIANTMKGMRPVRSEYRLNLPDVNDPMKQRWMNTHRAVVYDENGEPIRLIGVVYDVTDIKNSERLRMAARTAQDRTQALGDFIANMSHDLRTPLAGVLSSVDMIRNYPDKVNIPKRLDSIARQTEILSQMLENILKMAELDDTQQIEFKQHNLHDILSSVVDALQIRAEERQISLTITETQGKVVVNANAGEIYRVFQNLISNGIKYTNPGGEVVVTSQIHNDRVVIEIQDTGRGMSPDVVQRIFERFYRSDDAKINAEVGAGLGLAIVNRILELHQGSISVTSEPGVGSCFTVSLPFVAHIKNGEDDAPV